MTKMRVNYLGDLRTDSVHLQSGDRIITDAPKDNHGKGEAFSPTDLLSTSLASCMLTIMAIKGKSMDIDLAGVEIEVEKIMTDSPRRVGEIILTVNWNGLDRNIEASKLESLKRSGLSCPVMLSLASEVKKTVHW